LSGETFVPQPSPPSENAELKPVVKRVVPIRRTTTALKEEKPAAQPVARNSIELIEGAKRREVEIP
jgi:hypothetical protein